MLAIGIDVGGSSIKTAALEAGGHVRWTAQSSAYQLPEMEQLLMFLRQALSQHPLSDAPSAIGLCVPGLLDPSGRVVTYSANVPGLNGMVLDELIYRVLGKHSPRPMIVNDAIATATDIVHAMSLSGRVLVIALGTGVGLAVMDAQNRPLFVEEGSCGHIGQMDVSLNVHDAPIGADGGAGSLEAYIGSAALLSRFGSMEEFFKRADASDIAIRALARAIRICHAIYRPQHIVLAGGVGIRISHLIGDLKKLVDTNLTAVARRDWTLRSATHDFHAAIGAARLAALSLA